MAAEKRDDSGRPAGGAVTTVWTAWLIVNKIKINYENGINDKRDK